MAELNEIQKNKVNRLITELEVDQETAIGLVDGTISKEDYLATRKSKKSEEVTQATDGKSFLENEGYDVNLAIETNKKIKAKKDATANSAAADDFSGESTYLDEYTPSKADLVNLSGVTTDKDKELPTSIRTKLSFAVGKDDLTLLDAKKLYKEYLVDDKKFDKDLVSSLDDKIKFKYQKVGGKDGNNSYQVLVYQTPKELGGDGKWVAANTPSLIPNLGDLGAISGDVLPIATAVTGAVFGSAGGPGGTVAGSAGGTYLGELSKLYIGRKWMDLNQDMTDKEFTDYAQKQALIMAGVDLVLTPAMLVAGSAIKRTVMETAKDRLSYDSVKKILNGEIKFDDAIIKDIEVARNKLIELGVPKDLADEYTALSVARAIPESGIIEKGTKEDLIYSKKLKALEKKLTVAKVENKVIQKLSGLDEVNISPRVKDDLVTKIGDEVKEVRRLEIEAAENEIKSAEDIVTKNWEENFLKPEVRALDDLGVVFNDLQTNLKTLWNTADDVIRKEADNLPVSIKSKETTKVANKLLKDLDVKLIEKKPKLKNGKNSTVEEIKQYNKKLAEWENVNKFGSFLSVTGEIISQKAAIKIIKNGISQLSNNANITYKKASGWRAFILNAEQNLSLDLNTKNLLTKAKGIFQDAMDDAVISSGNTRAINANQSIKDLVNNYQGSAITKFADEFMIGLKRDGGFNVKLPGNQKNIFNSFIDDTPASLNNSAKLGNILNLEALTTKGDIKGTLVKQQDINKITNALYENYYNKVIPKRVNGKLQKSEMSHDEFIKKYGKNYNLILGNKTYKKFASSNKNAMDTFQKSVDFQSETINAISRDLPGLVPSVIQKDNTQAVVKHLFSRMRTNDVGALVKNLEKINPLLLKNIRTVFLDDFILATKPNGVMSGRALDNFITEYKPVLDKLYSKEFTTAYRDIAKGLRAIEDTMTPAGTPGAVSLTEQANRLGLLIDIFAGPLNHKRLILNRVARIHDSLDMGGDSLALLLDYKKFIEAARSKFLGGNYPKALDQLANSNSVKYRSLYRSFWDAIKKTATLGKFGKYEGPQNILYNRMSKKTATALEIGEDVGDTEEAFASSGLIMGQKLEKVESDYDVDPADLANQIGNTLGITIKDKSFKVINKLVQGFRKVSNLGKEATTKDYEKQDYEKNKLVN